MPFLRARVVATLWLAWGCILTLSGCSPPQGIHQERVNAKLSERRGAPAQVQPAPSGPRVKYKLPEGWSVGEPKPMRMASLEVIDADQKCDISVSQLGPGQSVGDNVNRWRKQVKLPDIAESELQLKPIHSGGHEGSLVQAIGETETILGVILPLPDKTYFVKLQGPNALALRELKKFIQFTETIEWP